MNSKTPLEPTLSEVRDYVLACAKELQVDCKVRVRYHADQEKLNVQIADDPDLLIWAACCYTKRNVVTIHYGPRLRYHRSARMWKLVVAHELLHAHLRKFRSLMDKLAHTDSGFAAWYTDTEEDIVEGLELVVSRLLPNPSWLR